MVSRRRRFFMLALLFMLPAPAHAGVASLEGTEIVYRGDARRDAVYAEGTAEAVTFRDETVTAGHGCGGTPVVCPAAGVTALRVIAGEGDDDMGISGPLPAVVDLGPGDDEFDVAVPDGVRPQALTLSTGTATIGRASPRARRASTSVPGTTISMSATPTGNRSRGLRRQRRPGQRRAECAARVERRGDRLGVRRRSRQDLGRAARPGRRGLRAGVTGLVERASIGTVARGRLALRAGTLAAPATVTVRIKSSARPYNVIARDHFRAPAGAVRRSLRLRPVRSPRVEAAITTRTRGERTLVMLYARITSRRPGQ